jgi:hypothetical protein
MGSQLEPPARKTPTVSLPNKSCFGSCDLRCVLHSQLVSQYVMPGRHGLRLDPTRDLPYSLTRDSRAASRSQSDSSLSAAYCGLALLAAWLAFVGTLIHTVSSPSLTSAILQGRVPRNHPRSRCFRVSSCARRNPSNVAGQRTRSSRSIVAGFLANSRVSF